MPDPTLKEWCMSMRHDMLGRNAHGVSVLCSRMVLHVMVSRSLKQAWSTGDGSVQGVHMPAGAANTCAHGA